jgi:hypothetical protein
MTRKNWLLCNLNFIQRLASVTSNITTQPSFEILLGGYANRVACYHVMRFELERTPPTALPAWHQQSLLYLNASYCAHLCRLTAIRNWRLYPSVVD